MAEGAVAGTMIFAAPCGACGAERKFIEFKIVPCGPHADAEKREYGFRCLTCKTRADSLTDSAGGFHSWERGQHVVRAPPR